jgi:hypothetical protein
MIPKGDRKQLVDSLGPVSFVEHDDQGAIPPEPAEAQVRAADQAPAYDVPLVGPPLVIAGRAPDRPDRLLPRHPGLERGQRVTEGPFFPLRCRGRLPLVVRAYGDTDRGDDEHDAQAGGTDQ